MPETIIPSILRSNLSPLTLNALESNLPKNTKQDHPLLKRYKIQIERGMKIANEINREARKQKIDFTLKFLLSDEICTKRLNKTDGLYEGFAYAEVYKEKRNPTSTEFIVNLDLTIMELMDDDEVKGMIAHELGHTPDLQKHIERKCDIESASLALIRKTNEEFSSSHATILRTQIHNEMDKLTQEKGVHYINATREREFQCDDFSAIFTGNRHAVISALEKLYIYELKKLETKTFTARTDSEREAAAVRAENLKYINAPHAYPGFGERILRQKSLMRLLSTSPEK
jgi:Zn-dependent protease with chaperone function